MQYSPFPPPAKLHFNPRHLKDLVKQAMEAFESISTPVRYKKGDLVHKSPSKGTKLYLVRQGILRSFYGHDGTDITAHFATEFGLVGAIDSLLEKHASIYSIEALEDSEVVVLDYKDLERFLDENPKHERMARLVSQYLYFDLVQRLEGMQFLSAREKYLRFNQRYPGLVQRVNLGHVASYLGMTQETLSRVRKQP